MIPSRVKTFLLTLGITGLLSLLLLISPLSLFSQDSSPPSSDFNGNGVVDIPDFLIFVDNFGKVVTRDESPVSVPSNVGVENGDSELTVRWDAVPDEEGKPSVTGYEVGYRERPDAGDSPSDEWAGIQNTSNLLDTSVTITGLLNGQAYLVSVRTLVDGGMSEWSSSVLGIPVRLAAGPRSSDGGGTSSPETPPPQNNLIPSAPTSFRHECITDNCTSIRFNWSPPTQGLPLLRYEFYMEGLWLNAGEEGDNGKWPVLTDQQGDVEFLAFRVSTTSGTFTFKVRAVNEHGTGPEASLTMTITPEDQ